MTESQTERSLKIKQPKREYIIINKIQQTYILVIQQKLIV